MLGALCVCEFDPASCNANARGLVHSPQRRPQIDQYRPAGNRMSAEQRGLGARSGDARNPRFTCHPDELPLLLFPHEGATPLTEFVSSARPLVLIVPDGTWRQASKVRNRVPGLEGVRCVSLPTGPPSAYRLRFEAHRDGLATMEAIARALGILEGDHIQRALDNVFRAVVERTLWSRGSLDKSDVVGPLPSGVMRHDPRRR